ncbi:integrase catalytic domain-containing protein [Saccharothrix isguenensis]
MVRDCRSSTPQRRVLAPHKVWSWDITALKGPVKGVWYRCYVVLDIFSRYVTGWLVAAAEDAVVAGDFLADAVARNGTAPHTVHADRGGAMVSKPVSELLVDLGVLRSHSRPPRLQRQPLLRGPVQDDEVHARLSRSVRLTGGRPRVLR